jgi:hypothetical protein
LPVINFLSPARLSPRLPFADVLRQVAIRSFLPLPLLSALSVVLFAMVVCVYALRRFLLSGPNPEIPVFAAITRLRWEAVNPLFASDTILAFLSTWVNPLFALCAPVKPIFAIATFLAFWSGTDRLARLSEAIDANAALFARAGNFLNAFVATSLIGCCRGLPGLGFC